MMQKIFQQRGRNWGAFALGVVLLLSVPGVLAQTAIPTGEASVSTPVSGFVAKTQADLGTMTANVQRPNAMGWYDGMLYTVCSGDWTVYQIDTVQQSTKQYIYGVKNAHSMWVSAGADGQVSLIAPDFQTNKVVEVAQGLVKPVAEGLNGPWGITGLATGQLLVTNLAGNSVSLINGREVRDVLTNLRAPTGITADSETVYVANTGSSRRAIEWYSLADLTAAQTALDSKTLEGHLLVKGVQNVTSVVLASDGQLYFSYALGTRGVIGRVDPAVCRAQGGCAAEAVEMVLFSELSAPLAGLTITPDMTLYIHSIYSPEIYWVQLQ